MQFTVGHSCPCFVSDLSNNKINRGENRQKSSNVVPMIRVYFGTRVLNVLKLSQKETLERVFYRFTNTSELKQFLILLIDSIPHQEW